MESPPNHTDDHVDYAHGIRAFLRAFSGMGFCAVNPGNWMQTVPGKTWWIALGLYHPVEPIETPQPAVEADKLR